MRHSIRTVLLVAGLAIVEAAMAPAAAAQDTRRMLLDRVPAASDNAERLELLMRVADPGRAPLDSLWATGVHTMANLLVELDDADLARVWLTWVARHGAEWPVDRFLVLPEVVTEYNRAAQGIAEAPSEGEGLTVTAWDWPEELDRSADGRLEVGIPDADATVGITIEGRGVASTSETLPPGTYTFDIEAEGYEPVRLTREVLPGVATIVEADPRPLLPANVEEEVAGRLVRITYLQGGQEVCTNGLLERGGYVITVLDATAPVAGLEVRTAGDDVFSDVRVGERDAATGVVALRVDGVSASPLRAAGVPTADSYAWSVHRENCSANPTSSRTLVPTWPQFPTGSVEVVTPFGVGATGAPVVDRSGGVLGLVAAGNQVAPLSVAQQLVETVIAQGDPPVVEPPPPPQTGGSNMWKWIGGAGAVGAVGILAAVLLGSDGDRTRGLS